MDGPGTRPPAVKGVHVVTTGHVEQHPEHRYGTRKPLLWWVLTSREWVDVPIHAFLLEHRDGLVLFDTGIDPALVSDPGYIDSAVGRLLLHRLFRVHVRPEDRLARRLEALGFDAADVQTVAVSHLHFDHIGGIADVPQADLLVSDAEWRRLSQPNPERDWVLREHIDVPGARWRPVRHQPMEDPLVGIFGGGHDVMRDGSMVLVPTPGHSVGSQSMLVRSEGAPPLLLVGDLTYELDLLMTDRVPGIGEPRELRASFAKVRELKRRLPDLRILPSHDPSAAARVARLATGSGQAPS